MSTTHGDLTEVLQILWKHRRKIILITGLAAVSGAIILLLMPNYYKASTVFFAASTDMNKPEQVFGQTNRTARYYGDDYDNDRLLTVARSPEVINYLIDSFDIARHYHMKANTPKQQYKLEKKFRKNYQVLKTKHDAISLTVEDRDPQLAAALANAAREKIGATTLKLIQQIQTKRIQTFKNSIREKSLELSRLQDSLQQLRRHYDIIDVATQREALATIASESEAKLIAMRAALKEFRHMPGRQDTVQILKASIAGLENQLRALRGDDKEANFTIKKLREGMSRIEILERNIANLSNSITYEKQNLQRAITVFRSNAPTIIIAEEAQVPKVKSRPKRSVLLLATTLIAFIFSALGALLIEGLKGFQLNPGEK